MSAPGVWELRARFEEVGGFTVGVEEETWLLHPDTFDLAPVADEVLARLEGDARFTSELPAAQLEIRTSPTPFAADAVAQIERARRELAEAGADLAVPAACAVHPTASGRGRLSPGGRYDEIRRRYGPAAERQLVASLQVHVAVGGADRTLAVHNALREYLPEIAALAANAPFYEGADTGLASVRPEICVLLPRQGVPPALESWDTFAAEIGWGVGAQSLEDFSQWWWELRPHPRHGTLEVRVPDAQTTIAEAAGVIAFVQALVATLAHRYDEGALLAPIPTWRIEENRFSASRFGLEGHLADLHTAGRHPTRERLLGLIAEVEPLATELGSAHLLAQTRASVARNGALRQRQACAARTLDGVAAWLVEEYLEPASID